MSEKPKASDEKVQAMLEVMWKRSRATIAERVNILRAAQKSLDEGALDSSARKNAESAAHKLAGTLGTFGIPEGSALASRMEHLLAGEDEIGRQQHEQLAAWLKDLEARIAAKGG